MSLFITLLLKTTFFAFIALVLNITIKKVSQFILYNNICIQYENFKSEYIDNPELERDKDFIATNQFFQQIISFSKSPRSIDTLLAALLAIIKDKALFGTIQENRPKNTKDISKYDRIMKKAVFTLNLLLLSHDFIPFFMIFKGLNDEQRIDVVAEQLKKSPSTIPAC